MKWLKLPMKFWFPWQKKGEQLAPGTYNVTVEDMIILPTKEGEMAVLELKVVAKENK